MTAKLEARVAAILETFAPAPQPRKTGVRVIAILARLVGSECESLSASTQLTEELGMDALGRLEFVIRLEDAFKIKIDDGADPPWDSWRTISDAVAAVEKEMQQ